MNKAIKLENKVEILSDEQNPSETDIIAIMQKEFYLKYQEILFLMQQKTSNLLEDSELFDYNKQDNIKLIETITNNALKSPEKIVETNLNLFSKMLDVTNNVLERFNDKKLPPLYSHQAKDKRFQDNNWNDHI